METADFGYRIKKNNVNKLSMARPIQEDELFMNISNLRLTVLKNVL